METGCWKCLLKKHHSTGLCRVEPESRAPRTCWWGYCCTTFNCPVLPQETGCPKFVSIQSCRRHKHSGADFLECTLSRPCIGIHFNDIMSCPFGDYSVTLAHVALPRCSLEGFDSKAQRDGNRATDALEKFTRNHKCGGYSCRKPTSIFIVTPCFACDVLSHPRLGSGIVFGAACEADARQLWGREGHGCRRKACGDNGHDVGEARH